MAAAATSKDTKSNSSSDEWQRAKSVAIDFANLFSNISGVLKGGHGPIIAFIAGLNKMSAELDKFSADAIAEYDSKVANQVREVYRKFAVILSKADACITVTQYVCACDRDRACRFDSAPPFFLFLALIYFALEMFGVTVRTRLN